MMLEDAQRGMRRMLSSSSRAIKHHPDYQSTAAKSINGALLAEAFEIFSRLMEALLES